MGNIIQRLLGWELKFSWIPKICKESNRIIWLEKAYRGTIMNRDDIHISYTYIWHGKNEHLVWKLKQ